MKKFIWIQIVVVAILASESSCKTNESILNEYAYQEFSTHFVNSNASGEIEIKCWGSGSNVQNAVENALKNGIETIMFKGLTTNNIPIAPLVPSNNSKLLDKFFKDRLYSSYIKENNKIKRTIAKSGNRQQIGLVAIVDFQGLKSYLAQNNIISK